MKRALSGFLVVLALPAAAQERIPAAQQHVTVPAPLGQGNKEILAQPGGTMKQASCGRILQGDQAATSRAPRVPGRSTGAFGAPDPGIPGNASYVPAAPSGPSAAVPAGPAVFGAAYVSVRGTFKTCTKDAITVVEKTGRERRVALAPRAAVVAGLKPGDAVVLRIPFDEGSDCRTADRVERPPAPRAAPKSKFSQAQTPGG